ncbi:sugar ABC transporter substrate-binding protein [Streptosporangium sp. NPDC004631]
MSKSRILSRGFLIGAACLMLSACTGLLDDKGDDGAAQKYVAMSFAGSDITIWNDVIKYMRPQVEKAGYRLLSDDPQWKAEKQVADWQAWIQRGDVKAIMGFPVQADSLVPVTKQAKDAGVGIISYAANWEGATPGLTVDDYESARTLGRDAGEWLVKAAGGKGTVAVLGDRSTDLGLARAKGLVDGVKEVAPDVTVKEIGGTVTREGGYAKAKAQLSADLDTRVWITQSDDLAKGAYRALLDSGVAKDDPKYFVGSLDATQETLDMLEVPNSVYRVSYIVTAKAIADINSRLLIAAAEGEPVKSERVIFEKITSENAGKYRE